MNSADLRALAATLEKSAKVLREVADHQDSAFLSMADLSVMSQYVRNLAVGRRAQTVLIRSGARLVSDLVLLTRRDLLSIRFCGVTTLAQIEKALAAHGLRLREESKDV